MFSEPSLSDSDLDFGDSPVKDNKVARISKQESAQSENKLASSSPMNNDRFEFTCLASDSDDDVQVVDNIEGNNKEQVEVIDLTLDSQRSLENFSPVENGSLGEFCSYCSGEEDSEEDSEVLVDFSKPIHKKQTVKERSSRFICEDKFTWDKDYWTEDTQSLHLNLDGASDESETTTTTTTADTKTDGEVKESGGAGDMGSKLQNGVSKKSQDTTVDSAGDDIDNIEDKELGVDNEKKESVGVESGKEKGAVETEKDETDSPKAENKEEGNAEAKNEEKNNSKAENEKDNVVAENDEKGSTAENDEKEDSSKGKSTSSVDSVDKSEGPSKAAEETGKAEDTSLELVTEDVEAEKTRKRSLSDSDDEPPAKKQCAEEVNSDDVITLDSDDDDDDEELMAYSSEEEDEEEENQIRQAYLARQQKIIKRMMERNKLRRGTGPIDLTEDNSDEEEEEDVEIEDMEEISEMDSEEEEELDSDDEDLMTDDQWMAWQHTRFLNKEKKRQRQQGPADDDCVIVVDDSSEEEEVTEKEGKKKEEKGEKEMKKEETEETENED